MAGAPQHPPAERLTDLAVIEAALWQEMALAATTRSHPWRTPVLATVAGVGEAATAEARVIVLRDVDPGSAELVCFTDARSPKAAQIGAAPLGTLVMWSPALNWQLRLRVALRLETTGLAVSSQWARLKLTPAAQDYLSTWPPGASLPVPGPAGTDDADLPDDAPPARPASASWSTRNHFARLVAQVQRMDWLELHPDGHRRAVFGDGPPRWVQA